MSVMLRLDNYASINVKERSYLNADAAANATTLTLENTQNFTQDTPFVVGRLSAESAERVRVAGVTGENVDITPAIGNVHDRFEEVTALYGDQMRIYRAAAPSDGSVPADSAFSVIGQVYIDSDQLTTDYIDSTGGAGFWYKFTYYNSITTFETDLSASVATRGTGASSHYVTLDDIRTEAGFQNNPNISDTQINDARSEAENEINSALVGMYSLPFVDPVPAVIMVVAKKLAAGLLLSAEYSALTLGATTPGSDKITEARATLKRIQSRQLILTDVQGVSESIVTGVSSYPNDDSTINEQSPRMFTMGDEY